MQLSKIGKIANPGGADRDRTDDIQLAKLALSQLSYGPGYSKTGDTNRGSATHHVPGASPVPAAAGLAWWAWVDLNYRPHAYQACALTS